jgi:hypothetical protein
VVDDVDLVIGMVDTLLTGTWFLNLALIGWFARRRAWVPLWHSFATAIGLGLVLVGRGVGVPAVQAFGSLLLVVSNLTFLWVWTRSGRE